MKYFLHTLLFLLLCSLSNELIADKTDVIFLVNGDRVTGEMKSLLRGKLELKTDHMGTVYIDWTDIKEVISSTGQAVELTNGQRFYGPLEKAENQDMLMVDTEQGTVGVGVSDVISLYPVEAGFWDRLDVSASLGFSWDKASEVGKYNIGMDAEYRDPRFITRANFSSEVTSQKGRDDTSRAQLELNHIRFRPNRLYRNVFGRLEKNDELGIELRSLLGAGYGWVPIRSQQNWFMVGWGVDINHEVPTKGDDETNLELVGMLTYDYFQYSHPKRRFTIDLTIYPSITDAGRIRGNFDMGYNFELWSDFFWDLSFYTQYDNKPISEQASKIDYGVVSSVAYKF